MRQLALKQLLFDPLRTGLTVLAIASIVAVVLILRGFETGLYNQSRASVMDRGADLIVAQAGVSNMLAVRSSIPQLLRMEVENVKGVVNAHPIIELPVIFEGQDFKTPINLFVYDTLGGPTHIISGSMPKNGREVVIDVALAKMHGLKPGDSLVIYDFEFRIAAITSNASALFMPFVFVNYDGMLDFYLESEIAPDLSVFPLLGFLLLELAPGANFRSVVADIEHTIADVDVLTPTEMAANEVKLGQDMFGPIMGLLIDLAYIIGLLVVGLMMYADAQTRMRSFGVMKALGFRQFHLISSMMWQIIFLLVVAIPFSLGIALIVANIIEWMAPLYLITIFEPQGIYKTIGATMVFAFLGGLLPLRLIARTDPTIVFQGN